MAMDLNEHQKHCWVCFSTEDEEPKAEWVQPCKCKGTTKWVHQSCLQRWIDEKQRGNIATKISCQQCGMTYVVFVPQYGFIARYLNIADRMLYKISPYFAAEIVISSVYWTAITFGALTVIQIMGRREAICAMEQTEPLLLIVGLPIIPIVLVLSKMLRWEEFVVKVWRKYSNRVPVLNRFINTDAAHQGTPFDEAQNRFLDVTDPIVITRSFCGALMFPTCANYLGRILFGNVQSNFKRAALGGLAFIAIKGICKIYLKNKQCLRQHNRRVLDFEKPTSLPVPTDSTLTDSTPTDPALTDPAFADPTPTY